MLLCWSPYTILNSKCLLKSWDEPSEVPQGGRTGWLLPCSLRQCSAALAACDGLTPLLQFRVANAHVGQERHRR